MTPTADGVELPFPADLNPRYSDLSEYPGIFLVRWYAAEGYKGQLVFTHCCDRPLQNTYLGPFAGKYCMYYKAAVTSGFRNLSGK